MPPKPLKDVFISSTSIDLPEYRATVRDAIIALGFSPSGMETWPVTGENPVDLCRQKVFDADVYIGIYAHRYGWRPDGPGTKSITEMEYDWAGEVIRDGKPIPRLCFIMRDDHPWRKDRIEIEAEADLKRFKTRIKENHVGFFTTPEDLKAKVAVALANIKGEMVRNRKIIWAENEGFDTYTLRHRLGEGGNGEVWLANEALPDGDPRSVAIKVLRTGIKDDPLRVERFRREISTMARINHPNIVPIYTYGIHDLYVVMPYLSGGTLRKQLTSHPMPLEQAVDLLEQIGDALDYVHDRYSGLIHHDVKPENMLFREDGETLLLADFGLVFSGNDDERLTDDGKIAGTGRYMAPEQWRERTLSRQTDLCALGILAYELLTGHLPYQYDNALDLGNAHCDDNLPIDPNLSDEVWRILQKATAKDPSERYPTARAFLTDLRNWKVDPGNLEPRIEDYLAWLVGDVQDRVKQRFVELAGDQTHLVATPKRRRRRRHHVDENPIDQPQ